MPSPLSFLPLAYLALPVFASPTHVKRIQHKRSTCVTRSISAVPVSSPSPSGTDGVGLFAAGQGPGHWQVYTTSTWVANPATDSPIPISSAVVDSSSASVTSVKPLNPSAVDTESAVSSGGQSESIASSDPNPMTSFLSSSADDAAHLSLSVGLDEGFSSGSASTSAIASTTSSPSSPAVTGSTGSANKHVFAHFMVGIVSTYAQPDWEADMTLAKSKGITGFALNIGVDPYTEAQLDLGYAAAQKVGFEVFISFDFNWYKVSDVSGVANMLKRYASYPAQFMVDGKPFVSTFIGDGFDWVAVAKQVGRELYAVPYWTPTQDNANNEGLSGLFSWDAWPGQLTNTPVAANMSSASDELYLDVTSKAKKTYMAPVSTWFSTHFGKEVSYSKNWVFYSEMLWKTRWDQILSMGSQLNFVEIVTWNDFGESHYIGPFNTPHTDDGSSKWAAGLDHTAMLDFAVPYIEAFKTGLTEPVIIAEMLVYWYRPHLKSAQCDHTDNCGSRPTGWDMLDDSVFVASMTKSGGSVTVTSGSNAPITSNVAPGVQVFQVPMGVGAQSFKFSTTVGKSGISTSNVTISADCWNGIYNYNYHSGSIIP